MGEAQDYRTTAKAEGCNFPKRLELSFLPVVQGFASLRFAVGGGGTLCRKQKKPKNCCRRSLKVRALPKASSKGFDSRTCFSTFQRRKEEEGKEEGQSLFGSKGKRRRSERSASEGRERAGALLRCAAGVRALVTSPSAAPAMARNFLRSAERSRAKQSEAERAKSEVPRAELPKSSTATQLCSAALSES